MRVNTMPIRRGFVLLMLLFAVPGAFAGDALQEYALVLGAPSLASQVAGRSELRSAAAASRATAILAGHTTLESALRDRGFQVVGSSHILVNAVFVLASARSAGELRAIPGVTHVIAVPAIHRKLDRILPLTNATSAWTSVGGVQGAGAGVKIAVLDTGIDQSHPGFQDVALRPPAGFPVGDPAYTNSKVIVARSYVGALPYPGADSGHSRPDDVSPRDRSGHGSAVAMIAAGVQHSGPTGTISGIAPKAWLGNYRIFGSPGVNDETRYDIILSALEDAINDGMDIALMAVGDPAVYPPSFEDPSCNPNEIPLNGVDLHACDIRAQAVENAVKLGLTVVLPAGNDGASGKSAPTLSTVETPGTAPSAITVAAATNSHALSASVRVPANAQAVYQGLFGDGRKLSAAMSEPVRDAGTIAANPLGCSPFVSGTLAGTLALIQLGTCTAAVKVANAESAGADGVILFQVDGTASISAPAGLGETGIPAVLIGNSDGKSLRTYLALHLGTTATLDPAWQAAESTAKSIAAFSSRGPSIDSSSIKPELTAPGSWILTAAQSYDPNGDVYSASRYAGVSGTSFAAAVVAGAAALVKQAHPDYTPAQVKSALVNNASGDATDENGIARAVSAGAGMLDAAAAVRSLVTADPATLHFGTVAQASLPFGLSLAITNTGSTRTTYSLSVKQRDNDNNASVTLQPASVALDPKASATVTVNLSGRLPSPGSYEGYVSITGGGQTVKVPYLYAAGNNAPANIVPLSQLEFDGSVNDSVAYYTVLKLIDANGIPVRNVPVSFAAANGGTIDLADKNTDNSGIAAARVYLGSAPGDESFTATAGSFSLRFVAHVRTVPAITAVQNGASFVAASSTQGLAPGSYITLRGSALSSQRAVFFTPYLPISIAGVSVSFDAGAISIPSRIHFVSPSQINVQIPWELQGLNAADMKVNFGPASSAVFSLTLAKYSPGLFEYVEASSGNQFVAAQDASFKLIGTSNPAARGQTVILYANGLGPVTDEPLSGEPSPAKPLAQTLATPLVQIGNVTAQVQFSGMTPGVVGLYQINVVVPQSAAAGIQSVTIAQGGIVSKPSKILLR